MIWMNSQDRKWSDFQGGKDMKQSVIQIKFDTDKYNALLRYARKKEVSVEAELLDTADRLYRKLVPSDVREFIEEREEQQKYDKPKKKSESGKEASEGSQENNSNFTA